MKRIVLLAAMCMPVALGGQDAPNPQKLYDAGHYEQAINAIASQGDQPAAEARYLAGHSYLRLARQDAARAEFAKLAAADDPTPWSLVGESAIALIDGNAQAAIESGRRAAEMAPDQFHPSYQYGLALSGAEQWAPAAAAFEKASAIDPAHAYAHYYAGLASSKVRRVDLMARHFEYFLKLAPEAPERAAVTALMRSVR